MLDIDKEKNIYISRAEDVPISIDITGTEISPEDVIFFVVRRNTYSEPVIQNSYTRIENNLLIVTLSNEDTNISEGNYIYEISIRWADNRKNKIFDPHKFIVLGGETVG